MSVRIQTDTASGRGVVLESNVVLTALHVVRNAKTLSVNGRPARIFARNNSRDIAWLSCNCRGMKATTLAKFDRAGETMFRGRRVTVGTAEFSRIGKSVLVLHRINRKVALGDSGSPIFQGGRVVGLVLVRDDDGFGRVTTSIPKVK